MPYADNAGLRIHYHLQPGGSAQSVNQPLLLLHGFMQTLDDWATAGYVRSLSADYPLLLLDARGHGRSDKPHSIADYAMELLVSDIVAVLDAAGIEQVHCLGYSFGGWLGFGLARYAPQRLRSLIVGGMHPYKRDPKPLARRIARFTRTRDALAAGGRRAELLPPSVQAQFTDNDIDALIAQTAAIRDAASLDAALDSLTIPALIYAGETDPAYPPARHCAADRPNLQFLSLPALGHLEVWQRSDLVLPPIQAFLQRVSPPGTG